MVTVKQLRIQAAERGIRIPSRARKADIERLLSSSQLGDDWDDFEKFLRQTKRHVTESDIIRQRNVERERQTPKPKPKPRKIKPQIPKRTTSLIADRVNFLLASQKIIAAKKYSKARSIEYILDNVPYSKGKQEAKKLLNRWWETIE